MKKLMVAFAAVALTVSAQANIYAQFKTQSPDDKDFSSETRTGYSCFFINGATLSGLVGGEALTATDTERVVDYLLADFDTNYAAAYGKKTASATEYWQSGSKALEFYTTSGVITPANVFGIITYKPESDVTYFRVCNQKGATTIQDWATGAANGVWSNWTAVPEPTSGLLLLLGVAGLALKRKRA